MPLQILSNDPQHQIFADAVSHELIVELSRLHWLHIIARGSSFRFRNENSDVSAVGKMLDVRYVVTGSLRITDKKAISTIELYKSADGQVIWADAFEGPLEDLLILQSKIIPRIVATIENKIQTNESDETAKVPTHDLDAWAAYHRGLWHMFRFNQHDNKIATQFFKRSIAADPRFSRAHSGLSFTHFQNAFIGFVKDSSEQRKFAVKHADISFELDPFDPLANLTMGRAEILNGNLEASIPWFDRCLELSPNHAFGNYNRGLVDAILGKGLESQQRSMNAISLSPLDPLLYAMLCCRGLSHLVRGEYATASVWAERGAERPNSHQHIWAITAVAHELAGHQGKGEQWAAKIESSGIGFTRAKFFQSFPLRDTYTHTNVNASLGRLGFQ